MYLYIFQMEWEDKYQNMSSSKGIGILGQSSDDHDCLFLNHLQFDLMSL